MNIKKTLFVSSTMAAAVLGAAQPAQAGTEPFLGEIMLVAGNYCPHGWAPAYGQVLAISSNLSLFDLIGSTYQGGDGRTTFALPDLRGTVPIAAGRKPGGSVYALGQAGGNETIILSSAQLAAHTHTAVMVASAGAPTEEAPAGNALATFPANRDVYTASAAPDQAMAAGTVKVGSAGSNDPVDIMQPYLAMTYCIALEGQFPARP